ncbi:MAG TPA: translation elongation factor 4 [Patescibacteria group bacterium]|nr:translation elongation factor 4 [Patescibacteria group bacterium]
MEKIRNFSIIAHVDHGKSTLADRFLEVTGTIAKSEMRAQYLDLNPIERERGITIKLQPVRMSYRGYTLNLIDTPGHVDFTYEVSRSLAACEGAILLVDAAQGIEAQTISVFNLARGLGLKIIPVINKIDLPNANISLVKADLVQSLGFKEEEIILVSGKTGQNVPQILQAVIDRVPAPVSTSQETRALVFDSIFDTYKGVIAAVRVVDGEISNHAKLRLVGSGVQAEALEVGYFVPSLSPQDRIGTGEVGYVATGLKDVGQVQVGDTLTLASQEGAPLPGYRPAKPMVFAGLFPALSNDYPKLRDALGRLKLNDSALTYQGENSLALGFGFRVGFLGLLHLEVVQERLEREYNLSLIASSPTVPYEVRLTDGTVKTIHSPAEWPDASKLLEAKEPWVNGVILTPEQYLGAVTELAKERRAEFGEFATIAGRIKVNLRLPLAEIMTTFYDRLKSVSSGYASFDYDLADFKPVDAVKLEILVAKQPVDALSQIVVASSAERLGKALVAKLKTAIPRQNFEVSIQASIGSRIIAREDIPALRKDVLAKMSGGHVERKMKLLEAQRKGKARMKQFGSVQIPQEAFMTILSH